MMAFLVIGLFAAFILVPAMAAWCVVFYLVGHRDGGAAVVLYGVNAALGMSIMWLAVRFIPLLSVLGSPAPWFYMSVAALGALMGTASARRMVRPAMLRTLA